jgi:hypothetical protein
MKEVVVNGTARVGDGGMLIVDAREIYVVPTGKE